jgi:fructokinase
MTEPLVAGIELGGTKCVCTLASGPGRVVDEDRLPTTTPTETMNGISAILDRWRDAHGFAALGIASFGPVELDRDALDYGHITNTPKPGWEDTDVAQRLTRRYGVPTGFDTDVSGAALSEGRWGGAQGLKSYAYITVGTGVGVGVIVDGKPAVGLGHAEGGHVRVPRVKGDDWEGACIFHGDCVEGLASGFAVEKRSGRKGGEIGSDDPVWGLVAHALAGLCNNLVFTCVPERILIGGGVATKQPQMLPMIREKLVAMMAGYAHAKKIAQQIDRFIAPPALGDQAGPLGSIALALDALAAEGR